MNKQLIRDLAITGGIYDCICDPYDKLKNGDYYSSVMVDLERFAEKIVKECTEQIKTQGISASSEDYGDYEIGFNAGLFHALYTIKQHFGVEE
jgi:hypothetical protein